MPAPDAASDPVSDPPPSGRGICDRADPSLRLCVDFESPLADRSSRGAAIDAISVSAMDRDGERAAALTAASTIHVHEAVELDVDRLTLDMWIRPNGTPAGGARYWILDNNTQYAASFTDTRKARCVIGSASVDSDPLADDGRFHHVACAYDGAKLKVFVDGDVSRCKDVAGPIPTTGADGLAIGANLSGSDAAPVFSESFVGGIDDVRVWARGDLDVCAMAHRTGCRTTCP